MIYLIYRSHISDLHHNQCNLSDVVDVDHYLCKISVRLSDLIYLFNVSNLDHDLSIRHIWSRSWSIWSICPIYLISIMTYPSDIFDLNHDLFDLSVRSIWSRSWSILSICPIYLISTMIYPSDICDLHHDLFDLSVRSIWSRSWSICSTYLIYIIIYLIYLSDLSDQNYRFDLYDLDQSQSNLSVR